MRTVRAEGESLVQSFWRASVSRPPAPMPRVLTSMGPVGPLGGA